MLAGLCSSRRCLNCTAQAHVPVKHSKQLVYAQPPMAGGSILSIYIPMSDETPDSLAFLQRLS